MSASGRVCKKCGYERKATDTALETECPNCGAIYAKVEQHLERLKADAAKRQEAEERDQQTLDEEAAKHQKSQESRWGRGTEHRPTLTRAMGAGRTHAVRSNALKLAVVAVVIAGAAYWYWSPLLAMRELQAAARDGDADSFNDRVDYPRLRESFKGQLSALMAERVGSADPGGSNAARAGAELGAALGMILVDRMVDAMVRPEFVMKGMQEGRFALGRGGDVPRSQEATKTDIGNLRQALKLYRLDNQRYPTSEQGLQALVTRPTAGPAPRNWRAYLDRLPNDPWGRPYQYTLSENGEIEVTSLGLPTSTETVAVAPDSEALSWSSERKGVNKTIFHLNDKKDESRKTLAIVLERSGFATWRVTEVRLPLSK